MPFPIVANLLDEISVVCLGQRQNELQSKLLLTSAYVSFGGQKLQKEICSMLLKNPTVAKTFHNTLVRLFDVDFVHWPDFASIETVAGIGDVSNGIVGNSSNQSTLALHDY